MIYKITGIYTVITILVAYFSALYYKTYPLSYIKDKIENRFNLLVFVGILGAVDILLCVISVVYFIVHI